MIDKIRSGYTRSSCGNCEEFSEDMSMRGSCIAFLTGILIFVLTYLSAWVAWQQNPMMTLGYDVWIYITVDTHVINEHSSEFFKTNGRYPESLDELKKFMLQDGDESPEFEEHVSSRLTDPWGTPFQYERTEKGYRLWSLGRTGKPGGVGIDAEIRSDGNGVLFPTPTPFQFIFEGRGSLTLFLVALAASCAAGLIWYTRHKPSEGDRSSTTKLAVSVSFVTIAAVVISIFLTSLYLAMQQSGH